MNPAFWHGRRVFLTGHTGFKGSWMSLWLQSLGANLTGYALQSPTQPSLFDEAKVGLGMRSIIGDIRDLAFLQKAMQECQPEIVIHMAAQPLVRYSYANPVETYSTNVMGTVHLLETVRHAPSVKAVVNITTDKCYENREWAWGYRENEPMGGYDPYSNSKGCAELVSSAYRSSFFNANSHAQHGVGLATVRAGNVIGGGDWAQDRLIPDILAAFEQGQRVNIRNPHSIRPWQHVLEPLRGYLTLAERLFEHGPSYAEGWNFGPNDEDAKPVGWIVEQMAAMWGEGAQSQIDNGEHPHEANYLKLDISKARSRLDWHPTLRLNDALALIIEWSKQRQAGADIRELTLAQIHSYQTLTEN
ncbi:CDP-glucose 4,6-dehydratase [Polaromonas sp. JS666]|uniref:CDP-glucose 4,6-dehydratase n=1 Tax=Polaromonas sp. (strain JS666 / ATCC BAA-500) TaxID=296591 RepID=UPI0000537910|nr:CDP-glucose 4,6-dehydratase [Polaromonas sp. JS666]ABE45904.1 NAD-dependent epimerase/dehydratase [Polaromonas sp. JS666]